MRRFRCAAVIFDCDGVLVDSIASVDAAWTRWAVEKGFDPAEITPLVHGRRSADTVAALMPEDQREEALERIDRYEIEDARSTRAIAGAAALLQSIPRERIAVVTSGTGPLARARLAAAHLPIPEVLISADDVRHGKPDPEGYRTAAERLGVAPGNAVVLEDTVAGIAAARAAGIAAVIGIGGSDIDHAADAVIGDLSGIRWTGAGLEVCAECDSGDPDRPS